MLTSGLAEEEPLRVDLQSLLDEVAILLDADDLELAVEALERLAEGVGDEDLRHVSVFLSGEGVVDQEGLAEVGVGLLEEEPEGLVELVKLAAEDDVAFGVLFLVSDKNDLVGELV